jgi:type I restriction enzyme, S subunit
LEAVKSIEASEAEIARYKLKKGDLLLTEGGDPDKLGRAALWNEEIEECIHQNHIFRVRITSPKIQPDFLCWLVGSERGKRYFFKSSKQTTGIASINKKQLSEFPLLLPALKLQTEFSDRLAKLAGQTELAEQSAANIGALFASLQHRAFRGELREAI